MSIKVESRGKYAGVKLHLEPDECEVLLKALNQDHHSPLVESVVPLSLKMGKKIKTLLAEDPDLLTDRSPERVAAILVKEVEKASAQLDALRNSSDWKHLNKKTLRKALLKHVE